MHRTSSFILFLLLIGYFHPCKSALQTRFAQSAITDISQRWACYPSSSCGFLSCDTGDFVEFRHYIQVYNFSFTLPRTVSSFVQLKISISTTDPTTEFFGGLYNATRSITNDTTIQNESPTLRTFYFNDLTALDVDTINGKYFGFRFYMVSNSAPVVTCWNMTIAYLANEGATTGIGIPPAFTTGATVGSMTSASITSGRAQTTALTTEGYSGYYITSGAAQTTGMAASDSGGIPGVESSNIQSNKSAVIGGSIVGALVLMAGIIALSVILIRRKKKKPNEDIEMKKELNSEENSLKSPNTNPSSASWTGSSKDFYELNYKEIELEKEIGRGAFGVVWKGTWRGSPVAVKTFAGDGLSGEEIDSFIKEIQLMKNIRPHHNVILLYGFTKKPLGIVTEFMKKGSLIQLLKSDEMLSPEVTWNIIFGIVSGMRHLHVEGIIHRDLAARNVLLGNNLEPKISDFGMSRAHKNEEKNVTVSNVGPLKWMAPESIEYKQYSFKSDVWSFGVLLVEIATREGPYKNLDAVQVATKVARNELKPSLPKTAPSYMCELVESCCQFEPSDRPSFEDIQTKYETN